MCRVLAVIVAALIVPECSLTAQNPPRLDPQSHIRLWAASPLLNGDHGIVLGLRADTLQVVVADNIQWIPLDALSRLDVRTRRRGGYAGDGFELGLFVGAIVGYTAFRPSAALCEFRCNMRPANAVYMGLITGAVGAILGAVLPNEKWVRVR